MKARLIGDGIPNKDWYAYIHLHYFEGESKKGAGRYRSNFQFLKSLIEREFDFDEIASLQLECRLFRPPKYMAWKHGKEESLRQFLKRAEQWARTECKYEEESLL